MTHTDRAHIVLRWIWPARTLPRPRIPGKRLVCWLIVCAALASPAARAQQPKAAEYDVKAAYLYNFGKFVDWPDKADADKTDSFAICVLGRDPFGPALDAALTGHSIDGKKALARRISQPEEAAGCRVLFIGASEGSQLQSIVRALDKMAILTVSDIPQFSRRGGMIEFVSDGKRVRFEVNLTNADNAGLTLSSELLKVATTVRRSAQSGA